MKNGKIIFLIISVFHRTKLENTCYYVAITALDDNLVRQLAGDEHRLVRLHLVKALAERPDWNRPQPGAGDLVREKLFDPDPFVRRAAADALGRHPDSANVVLLIRLWEETPPHDTYLIHTVRMALRDQFKQTQVFADHAHLGVLFDIDGVDHIHSSVYYKVGCKG